jgi:very-short-patch-repair endonuclease
MIETTGKNGRPLKHPRADWVSNPTQFGLPPYVRELEFHPQRKWRFDFAWPAQRVALELDGGAAVFGRHSRPAGMRADNEKLNTAQVMGWVVLRILKGEELRVSTLELLKAALVVGDEQAA